VAGPLRLKLNLGPGDGPYVEGFTPSHEVDDKVGTHWTTYDAAVRWPLTLAGPAVLEYRLARMLPETAQVDVVFEGQVVDHFSSRGGTIVERSAGVSGSGPLAIGFHIESHDRRGLGLRLDWVAATLAPEARVRLAGAAASRAGLLAATIFLLLRLSGWGRRASLLLAAPWAVAMATGLRLDPWLTHRLLTGLPETLAGLGVPALALGGWLRRRGRLEPQDLARLTALALTAFLVRAAATNHPDFYYPDLKTHASLILVLRDAGLSFFASPVATLNGQGAWTKPAYGDSAILPYAVGFHSLFLWGPSDFDALLTAERLVGAAVSTLPLLLLWGVARRLEASTLGALLMLLVPTYTSRLSFALLPALFGHAWDMALIFWLAGRTGAAPTLARWAPGALLVAACQLAYVSSVNSTSLLLLFLGVFAALTPGPGRRARAAAPWLILAAGSLVSLALYYRHFLLPLLGLLPRAGGGTGAVSRYPIEGFLWLAYSRTHDFFDGVLPVLTLGGLAMLAVERTRRPLLAAWLATYLGLILLRAKIPDIFRYGHETLFVTPLVCLAAGHALAWLNAGGGWRRALAAGLIAFLAAQGALAQWRSVAAQLANAL